MILSTPSSPKLYHCSTTPRVFTSHSISRISYFVNSVGCGGARRRTRSPFHLFCASKSWGTAEILDESKNSSNVAAATTVVASSSASDHHDLSPPRSFLAARSEQDLLLVIQKEAEAGRLPNNVAQGMTELYHNYRDAVLRSGHPKADEIVISNMAITLDRIFSDVQDPFQFSPYHIAIREPFDYYMFGQGYIRPLVDFGTSFLGNSSIFNEIEKKLEQGENVILMSNHQTEADPAVIALLLESTNPFIAENLVYVAGDRVLTDPLSKPFSMGRNLLCVYSKKHMNDDPELIDMKRRANTKSLKEMALLLSQVQDSCRKPYKLPYNKEVVSSSLPVVIIEGDEKSYPNESPDFMLGQALDALCRAGAKIIWIAPSGGRDRPDPITKEWHPAPFDASAVDNMRRLVEHAGIPGHIYPLAIMCHELMPPPLEVEKEIGERREISFHGVGVSVGPAVDYHKIYSALEDLDEAKSMYSELLYSSICEQYDVLKSAIYDKQGLEASIPTVLLTQPWQ